MHGHRVVHRDMKCSNIFIKMFCDCENILTCACSFKYNVCLADFDAALRLDSEGHIPPMPAVPSWHHLTGPPVYQVVPVGTDGYRAPESAQVVLASHASAFDPLLTEKADIWSVGLIMIRMLNGPNGPIGQQKVSLQLFLHELLNYSTACVCPDIAMNFYSKFIVSEAYLCSVVIYTWNTIMVHLIKNFIIFYHSFLHCCCITIK